MVKAVSKPKAKAIAHNPTTVWSVPAAFRPIYSHAREVASGARLLFISGQFGVDPDGSSSTDFRAQAVQAMANIENLLAAANMSVAHVVKLNFFVTRPEDLPTLAEARTQRWGSGEPPAVTVLVVAGLANPKYSVEIEAVAAAYASEEPK